MNKNSTILCCLLQFAIIWMRIFFSLAFYMRHVKGIRSGAVKLPQIGFQLGGAKNCVIHGTDGALFSAITSGLWRECGEMPEGLFTLYPPQKQENQPRQWVIT